MINGGPAFPTRQIHATRCPKCGVNSSDGMSLRDYFAGQALAGILSRENPPELLADVADDAFAYADAMLKAREDPR